MIAKPGADLDKCLLGKCSMCCTLCGTYPSPSPYSYANMAHVFLYQKIFLLLPSLV